MFFRNFILRRRLRPIIRTLPHMLRQRYGAGKFYTIGQVETVSRLLNLKSSIWPYALAVACTSETFADADQDRDEQKYADLREEVSTLFDIDDIRLNCAGLVFEFKNPIGKNDNLGNIPTSGNEPGAPGS